MINNLRKNNKLNVLKINYDIPDYIIKESTEIILSYQNIIKLSKYEYLFRFNNINFTNSLLFDNKEILTILLNERFNRINIIQQGDYKYILVYIELCKKAKERIKIESSLKKYREKFHID